MQKTFFLVFVCAALAAACEYRNDDDNAAAFELPTNATVDGDCLPFRDDARVGDVGYDFSGEECALGDDDLVGAGVEADLDATVDDDV